MSWPPRRDLMALFGRKNYTLVTVKKKDIPIGLWTKCPECETPTYRKELESNLYVCPKCGYHFSVSAHQRIDYFADEGTFEETDSRLSSLDPLEFRGPKTYKEKLEADQQATGLTEAVLTGTARLKGMPIALAVTDSRFIMGSMGAVVGERMTRLVELATQNRLPVIIISASGGGARMYEGVYSLMQMAKTCAALSRHHQAGLPHISFLTNPTMAGIMASFAGIGDVILAEPRALIGFTGPRVIEQTIRQKLPEGFQRSEFLLAHGLIDMIIDRRQSRDVIGQILAYTQRE